MFHVLDIPQILLSKGQVVDVNSSTPDVDILQIYKYFLIADWFHGGAF